MIIYRFLLLNSYIEILFSLMKYPTIYFKLLLFYIKIKFNIKILIETKNEKISFVFV